MKSKTTILILLTIVIAICFKTRHAAAELIIGPVTAERAKQLGVVVHAKPSGPDMASIQLEFKAEVLKEGGLRKDGGSVSLEIRDGDKLLFGWSSLKINVYEDKVMTDYFMVDRKFMEKVTLRIVHGMDMGDDVRLKDFVDVTKLDDKP